MGSIKFCTNRRRRQGQGEFSHENLRWRPPWRMFALSECLDLLVCTVFKSFWPASLFKLTWYWLLNYTPYSVDRIPTNATVHHISEPELLRSKNQPTNKQTNKQTIYWVTLSFRNTKVLHQTLNPTAELWCKTLSRIKSIWCYTELKL